MCTCLCDCVRTNHSIMVPVWRGQRTASKSRFFPSCRYCGWNFTHWGLLFPPSVFSLKTYFLLPFFEIGSHVALWWSPRLISSLSRSRGWCWIGAPACFLSMGHPSCIMSLIVSRTSGLLCWQILDPILILYFGKQLPYFSLVCSFLFCFWKL